MKDGLRYDDLADALARLGFKQEPAEYHGALCGALCVREPGEIDPLRLLEGPKGAEAGDAAQALHRLRGQSAESFVDSELGFEPLLPDDEEELARRVRALGAWCEGFLFGLATGKPISMKSVSPELKEIVNDFTEFTKAGVGEEDDGEIEETAYAELVEYIRVGAQLIYLELRERAPSQVH